MYLTPTNIVPALVICIVIWRVIRRVQRNVGRQPVKLGRMVWRIAIWCIYMIMLGAISMLNPKFMVALGGGFIGGVLIGLVGLKLTQFETAPDGHYYTPNTYIGVAVSVILIGRIVYRLTLLHDMMNKSGSQPPGFLQSPLTLLMFGVVGGYYITYYSGLLIWAHRVIPANTTA